jgi:hypothetical protein
VVSYVGPMIKYLANTNGIRRCAEVDLDNYGQDV